MVEIKLTKAKVRVIALVAAATLASPGVAWSFGGGIGCADLPEYDRAVGVLQGIPSACDMSVERAKQIVAAHDGQAEGQPSATAPRVHHRRHSAQ